MRQHLWLRMLLPIVCGAIAPTATLAQSIEPANDGTGTIVTPQGNQYLIDGGQRSADGSNLFHSFEEFGLNAGQTANFLADPNLENILGRVVGGNASYIDGLIQVTGGNANVFLINPAGIIFGQNASLNVPANFTATTATRIGFENNTWFNALGDNAWGSLLGTPNALAFDLTHPGAIANAGSLSVPWGQTLNLTAGVVANTGELSAAGGRISIAAAPGSSQVRLSSVGNILSLDIAADMANAGAQIAPQSLPELLTGETAIVPARQIAVNPDGTVSLSGMHVNPLTGTTLIAGDISVAHTESSVIVPPTIQILGDRIALLDANLNAAATHTGGNIFIGGDFQGRGTLPNASQVFVDGNSVLSVDALRSGSGGSAIIWANGTTQFYGSISARGGTEPFSLSQNASQDGGFVEISGKEQLVFRGRVDTGATYGRLGTILFDPDNIAVDSGTTAPPPGGTTAPLPGGTTAPLPGGTTAPLPGGTTAPLPGGTTAPLPGGAPAPPPGGAPPKDPFAPPRGGAPTLRPDDVANANGNIRLSANNDIVISSPIAAPAGVELRAGRGIYINANIDANLDPAAGVGSIVLRANDTGAAAGLRESGAANIYQAPNTMLNAGRGAIQIEMGSGEVGDISLANLAALNGLSVNANRGNILRSGNTAVISASAANFQTTGSIGTPTEPLRLNVVQVNPPADAVRVFYEDVNSLSSIDEQSVEREISTHIPIEIDPQQSAGLRLSPAEGPVLEQNSGDAAKPDTPPEKPQAGELPPLADRPPSPPTPPMVESIEEDRNSEFQHLLGLSTIETASVNPREALSQITEQTGNRSAVIYVTLLPDGVELLLITGTNEPIRYLVPNVSPKEVTKAVSDLRRIITNPRLRSTTDYLAPAQQLYQWTISPLKADLEAANIDTLLFSLPAGLRSIPLAALHDGEHFLVENYSLSLIPSMSLVDTRYRSLQNTEVLGMGASEFTQLNPLPAVPIELTAITQNVWQGKAFLNGDFTRQNLISQRQEYPYPIIHLATHGEFQSGDPSQSYIQLWDEKLSLDRLRELRWNDPPVELLVLSACQTAVGDADAELGFAGLAVAAGVKSAIASLWSVSDEGTLALMAAFYQNLNHSGIKAEALRQAQMAMIHHQVWLEEGRVMGDGLPEGIVLPGDPSRRGRIDLSHPYYWSAFTTIGSPW
jgi:filamentous hemagglutinin family protein